MVCESASCTKFCPWTSRQDHYGKDTGIGKGKKELWTLHCRRTLEWFLQNKLQNRQFQNANNHHHFQADDQAQSLIHALNGRRCQSQLVSSGLDVQSCTSFLVTEVVLSGSFVPRQQQLP